MTPEALAVVLVRLDERLSRIEADMERIRKVVEEIALGMGIRPDG